MEITFNMFNPQVHSTKKWRRLGVLIDKVNYSQIWDHKEQKSTECVL